MNDLFRFGTVCLTASLAWAQVAMLQPTERYVYAQIDPGTLPSPALLWDAGADEHTLRWSGNGIEAVFPEWGVELLRRHGATVRVLVPDLAAYYADRLRISAAPALQASDPLHFRLGTMAGFYRLAEIWQEFARMREAFPEAVSGPDTIGFSVEGRPILAYRFTLAKNPDTLPAVLYTALHHAREPGGVTTLVYFLWWLLEHAAAGHPEALYLLQHRLLVVVPVVNPDGYAFNEAQYPQGGGMWRKNRRPNPDGSVGVDLNRNYGPLPFWDAPNGGSSTNPRSEVYRGSAPFSEPETQAIRDLCLRYRFRIALNYHTYSNLLIYPFSALEAETPDSLLYRLFCAEATRWNNYSLGRDLQTVGYTTRGVSDDWMYDTTGGKPKTLAMTPEVGTILDGFWPPAERIPVHARENLWLNLQTAWSAGANVRPLFFGFQWDSLPVVWLHCCNIGLESAPAFWVQLQPLNAGVTVLDSLQLLPPLAPAECSQVRWHILPTTQWRNGDSLAVEAVLLHQGVPRRDTLRFRWGRPSVLPLFALPADTSKWLLEGWRVEYDSTLGAWSLISNRSGTYPDSATLFTTLRTPLELPQKSRAMLEFWTRWGIEANYDIATLELSTDGGQSWHLLKTNRMRQGLGLPGSRQEEGMWGWDGNFPVWIPQRCDLSPWVGNRLLLRFSLRSDPALSFTGIALAQIRLLLFPDTPQSVPAEQGKEPALSLFPNPARGGEPVYLRLREQLTGTTSVEIFSVLGERIAVVSSSTLEGVTTLRLPAGLPAGVYYLRLQGQGQQWKVPLVLLP
jgi:hypothetical protein